MQIERRVDLILRVKVRDRGRLGIDGLNEVCLQHEGHRVDGVASRMEELDFLRDHRRPGTPCADRDRGSATEVPERDAACQRPEHLLAGGVALGVLAVNRPFPTEL